MKVGCSWHPETESNTLHSGFRGSLLKSVRLLNMKFSLVSVILVSPIVVVQVNVALISNSLLLA